MLNMVSMAAAECRTSNSERAYFRFLADLGQALNRHISLGTRDESNAYDLYADGCTAREAADEFVAQGW